MEADNLNKYCSAKTVLSTILLNSDTIKILDEYIISYLKINPSLVTEYVNQNGMYNVYIRSEIKFNDNFGTNFGMYDSFVDLLKSFALESEAKNWIIENGSKIIENTKNIFNEPLVLTIIYESNVGIYDNHDDACPSHYSYIMMKKYPTFAFCLDACTMLVNETNKNDFNNKQERTLKDLYWVTYIDSKI